MSFACGIQHPQYDTGVQTSSEVPRHSQGHSWCYLLYFFPNRRLQFNQITWTKLVYLSFQITPMEEIARSKIGGPCEPRNIAAVRDDVPRKELPQVTDRSLCGMFTKPNVLDISSKLVQLWMQEIFQHFNVTSRCNGYCTAALVLKKSKAPKHQILLQHTKLLLSHCEAVSH